MHLSAPIHRLKRDARRLARSGNIPLHAALDRVATGEGFRSWSHLADTHGRSLPARRVLSGLAPGDLLLVGARPGQGKTLFALGIAAEAAKAGRRSIFFTLEYAQKDIAERLAALQIDLNSLEGRFTFDLSDGISAGHVVRALADAPRGTVAVVDYLQILDQRRENPDLDAQVRLLKGLAAERGLIFVFVSQIDRAYDPAERPVPDWRDVRLPNPLNVSLFDKGVFLHGGETRFVEAG